MHPGTQAGTGGHDRAEHVIWSAQGFPATPKSPKPAFEGSSILRRASERMLRASATARARLMSGSGESSDSNSCGTPRIGPFQLECPRPQDDAKEGTPRSAISEITSRASTPPPFLADVALVTLLHKSY